MKVLWVTPRLPDPPDSGGKIVTFYTVKQLSLRGHEITLYTLVSDGEEIIGASPARELSRFADLQFAPSGNINTGAKNIRNYLHLFGSLFSDRPYVISKYWNEAAWRSIARLLNERSYDLMHCDHLHTAEYCLRAKEEFGIPIILTAHNVEGVLWERAAQLECHPAKRVYARLQQAKMRTYEAQAVDLFDRCIVLSPVDAERMRTLAPEVRLAVIPPGVDIGYFHPLDARDEPGAIVFVGAMDWPPNIEGTRWFYKQIWPQVKRAVRGAKLYIVGSRPPRTIRRLARDRDIIVTGWVEDVRDYMAKAQVFIVPLRIGSGMRIKILNALAMGKAVVSTSLGCEGIRRADSDGTSCIWLADTAEEFAQGVIALLSDPDRRRQLGTAGVRLVRSHYRWERAAEGIEEVYRQVVKHGEKYSDERRWMKHEEHKRWLK